MPKKKLKSRESLATNAKEYEAVQKLMDEIVRLNEKQLHLLTWRLNEFFRERRFIPVLLNMLEQNPPRLRNSIRKMIRDLSVPE